MRWKPFNPAIGVTRPRQRLNSKACQAQSTSDIAAIGSTQPPKPTSLPEARKQINPRLDKTLAGVNRTSGID
ncbi:MAG: hypothetical protein H7237_02775 [Alkalinema sp. FL-bin-369]|nr:hypothetical protein [Leptolyngbyaceae cyanobacterium LF-bin-369]